MILVDTTIWIDFLNGNLNTKGYNKLTELLENNENICLTDIILMEILQGIKDDKKHLIIKNNLLSLKFVHAKKYDTYIHASEIYRKCRKNGITIRKSIDCIIAAIAIENDLTLLHNDNDFNNISKIVDLDLL